MVWEEKACRRAWNQIYREGRRVEATLNVDENLPSIAEFLKRRGVRKVLDLGCGAGRNAIYMARRSFEVYGIDISDEGVKVAKRRIASGEPYVHLKLGSMFSLPYRDDSFDAAISITVIHHGRLKWIKRTIRELKRVLKPGGLIFVTVPKMRLDKDIPKERMFGVKFVAPRTYVALGGDERGVPHYVFNRTLLRRSFKGFKIHNIWINQGSYCLLGELRGK